MAKINDERFKAFGNVFDQSTLRGLFKLSSQGYFDEMASPISIGKEANVFSAKKDDGFVAIKIYRTAASFQKMYEYMLPDPRFAGLKKTKMGTIFTWAKKEYRNLLRARAVQVGVPKPIAVHKNILVMEFIGDKEPAQQIHKDYPKNPKKFYETLINDISTLYHEGQLVHADLSEFNILNWNQKPVMIDISHGVTLKYPNVKKLLERDIKIICTFFNKRFDLKLDWEQEVEKCLKKK